MRVNNHDIISYSTTPSRVTTTKSKQSRRMKRMGLRKLYCNVD